MERLVERYRAHTHTHVEAAITIKSRAGRRKLLQPFSDTQHHGCSYDVLTSLLYVMSTPFFLLSHPCCSLSSCTQDVLLLVTRTRTPMGLFPEISSGLISDSQLKLLRLILPVKSAAAF